MPKLLKGKERADARRIGLYTITCTANGRVYVGQSSHVYNRICGHKSRLRGGTHPNAQLLHDFRQFGEAAFIFQIEQHCQSEAEARMLEASLVRMLSLRTELYNWTQPPRGPGDQQPSGLLRLTEEEPPEDSGVVFVRDLLRQAEAKGLSDRDIAAITGRNYTTVWRWRRKPGTAFVFDEGIRRLMEDVGEG